MKRGDILFIEDILECMQKIETYISELNYQSFIENQMAQDAVIRNLEVMGEAATKISNEVKLNYSEVPWKQMSGLRNILIHEYFGIDLEIIWHIVNVNLKDTKPLIKKILCRYKGQC